MFAIWLDLELRAHAIAIRHTWQGLLHHITRGCVGTIADKIAVASPGSQDFVGPNRRTIRMGPLDTSVKCVGRVDIPMSDERVAKCGMSRQSGGHRTDVAVIRAAASTDRTYIRQHPG